MLRAGACIDLGALCIMAGKSCWVLCVDALVLSADGGLVDALSIATKVSGFQGFELFPKPLQGAKTAGACQ